MRELRARVHGPYGEIPLLLVHGRNEGRFRGTVLYLHGLTDSKDTYRDELVALAERGFLAVGVDAIAHGDRRATDFEAQARQGFHTILRWVAETAREIPLVLDALSELMGPATGRFGLAGLSFGGYVAFKVGAREPRLEALVSILGSPDWTDEGRHAGGEQAGSSPHRDPAAFAPRALLAITARRDANVPPAHSRNFVQALRPHYAAVPDRLQHVELEAGHLLPRAEWLEARRLMLGWFDRHLG